LAAIRVRGAFPIRAFGCGALLKLTPPAVAEGPWAKNTTWSFSLGDGAVPKVGLLLGPRVLLYGTTVTGGAQGIGTIFSIRP